MCLTLSSGCGGGVGEKIEGMGGGDGRRGWTGNCDWYKKMEEDFFVFFKIK